jgi:two-component system, sensor histidine kinase and response regulator
VNPNPSLPRDATDILIVDDTPANLQVLSGLLKERGYKVRPVPNGRLALQAARNVPPDLILLDIKMPEMDGFEVCRQLKADARLREIPVIFISALDEALDKVQAFGVGGVDYVTKPFQFGEVEARVRTHLGLRHLQRELEQQNARLEELVQARTQQLAESNARLAVLDKAKSDFLKVISHELRTPLTGVLGIAELVFRECNNQPIVAELQGVYEQARRRLLTLFDDALLLTEIELAEETGVIGSCPLSTVLESALDGAAALARSRGVPLPQAPGGTDIVLGQAGLLARALQSLLETAIKFSSCGAPLRLAIRRTSDAVQLVLETRGLSIPPPLLSRFFDVLAIGDTITPGGDLGLATAVAERIMTLFGGSVGVENLDPAGIRLCVHLKAPRAGGGQSPNLHRGP